MVRDTEQNRERLYRNLLVSHATAADRAYTTEGVRLAWVEENALDDDHPYAEYLDAHVTPEFGVLAADDGQTLHYSILKPHDFDETKTYPVVVQVYGGPHVQRVQRDWRPLSDIMLAQKGHIVFRLDNRGSSNRGQSV